MLSDRISKLFHMLGCNNTDIARAADCSPSNISRMHAGSRHYKPGDRSVTRLVEGLYTYADNLNLLPSLCKLCRVDSDSRAVLIPALVAWLFDTDEASLPEIALFTERKTEKVSLRQQKCRSFGERLDRLMDLLDLSNMRLARQINVDASHISRFRCGVRSPKQNTAIVELLVSALLKRAAEQERLAELSKLSRIPVNLLMHETTAFSAWLYDSGEGDTSDIDRLLDCIDSFSPDSKVPLPDIASFATDAILNSGKKVYWGVDGLREAVIRFLGNTAAVGGELWLYSDEDINWMIGSKEFFAKWFALMLACVRRGVKVRIVHNLDRGAEEMISAIQSWMPLYMSGMIEAYVCRRGRDARFTHTVFLQPGYACVHGSHIKGTESGGWYDYLTDAGKIKAVTDAYEALLAQSEPLLRIVVGNSDRLLEDRREGDVACVLSSLSLGTMPEKLLLSMLARENVTGGEAARTTAFCKVQREKFAGTLAHGNIFEFSTLPTDEELFGGHARVNLSPSLTDAAIFYTPEEYTAHIRAVSALLDEAPAYHFYVLPELPFSDIQIIKAGDRVTVIRAKAPYAAFVFSDPMMLRAFDSYFEVLKKRYACDRSEVGKMLRRFL